MTLKKIRQIHTLVMGLRVLPRSMSFCNAYIDQALMNYAYETMTQKDQNEAWHLIAEMITKFNTIRGR